MDMSCFRSVAGAVLSALLLAGQVQAAGSVNQDYVRSLAAPRKTVLVVEYYDGGRKAVSRKGYSSAEGFKAISPTDVRVDDKVSLHLYGLEPCQGEMVNRSEGFAGSCEDYGREQLAIKLKAARVIFCRAFLTEEKAAKQDVTCFGYYNFPGSLDTVDNIEEQLVSIGALKLARKPDGSPLRGDLADAEKIGRGGFGMWADPRVQEQAR
ncbi:hypothetical protein J2046_006587 [Rhizobium petrolearium]|uniref:Nuclease n=2 Tax=Neorhizobium TaxID=1525371 RepID=A0ABV0MC11_9HYPH|nr:hypothetical protein [Neorhizobium petrolearium]MBP1848296.1 hypothetical protein [Neorhizobium petrolearium]MCC2614452.1 hypothetical protein [Neorhizobium petrolearium]WGI72218.1 hypothetical protein QEO92_32165 [Neorhizobium petrolearium]